MNYKEISWADDLSPRPTGKYSTLAFSQANRFRMSDVPHRHMALALAAFADNRGNLMRIVSSGHEIDVVDTGALTVMLPLAGSLEVLFDGRRFCASAGGVLCFGPSERRTRVTTTDGTSFQAYLLKVPVATLGLAGLRAEYTSFESRDPFIPTAVDAARALRILIDYTISNLGSSGALLPSERALALTEALVHEHLRVLVESESNNDDHVAPASVRTIRQAEEFMRAHFAEPLRVSDIARAVGVGVRTLESAFQSATGSTPRARLTAVRLEQARLRLLTGGEQDRVTSIALESGFAHLGRFSRIYKDTYGERPSETLFRLR